LPELCLYIKNISDDESDEGTSNVWMFVEKEKVKYIGDGPDLKHKRAAHGCAIFISSQHSGRPLLVVAGGNTGGLDAKTSEYWDFSMPNTKWQLSMSCTFIMPYNFEKLSLKNI
jgi:hypothetical protein